MTKRRIINLALAAVYAIACTVIMLDLFVWRP